MTTDLAERVARALLYEGYALYPYRPSSLKNRQRWMFGTLYPPAFCRAASAGDRFEMATECLVKTDVDAVASVRVVVRFLELDRVNARASGDEPPAASERSIDPGLLSLVPDDATESVTVVTLPLVAARVTACSTPLGDRLFKIRLSITNTTEIDDPTMTRTLALSQSLVSVHAILRCDGGKFVSLLEPPEELAPRIASLVSDGLWPVLVGESPLAGTMLASPIILYDCPKVAPESPGDLFDSTEIDEILTLRILTLTDEERREMAHADPRCRAILERTLSLGPAALASLHGAWRERGAASATEANDHAFRRGDRVVVKPRPQGDVLDIALAGEAATITSVEEDLEGRVLFGVTIDSDPGKDLGEQGRPGHRFFFAREDLEWAP